MSAIKVKEEVKEGITYNSGAHEFSHKSSYTVKQE